MDSGSRAKHLEMIQAVINRLANTSFVIKGWGLTIVAGLVAVAAAKDSNSQILLAALAPVAAFGFLDAYYLWLERIFRAHYARVRIRAEQYDFDMNVHDLKENPVETYWEVLKRPSIGLYWLALLAAAAIGYLILKR